MKNRLLTMIVASFVALLAGTLASQAQGPGNEMVANVSFGFTAEDKAFPAGSYKFARRSADAPWVVMRLDAGGENTMVSVLTRLAQRDDASASTDGSLVFDLVGGAYMLSEIWIPGQDGFLVRSSAGEHQHAVVPLGR